MSVFGYIALGSILANFLIAFVNTLNKEKLMIKEGGKPLPSSAYVFLTVRYLLWALVFTLGLQLFNITPTVGMLALVESSILLVITYIISVPIEVVIRTLIAVVIRWKRTRELASKTDEKE